MVHVLSWFVVVHHGSSWFCHGSCFVMVRDVSSWFVMVRHGSCFVMVCGGSSWFVMVHGLSWFVMVQNIPDNFKIGVVSLMSQLQLVSWFIMVRHGSSWFNTIMPPSVKFH